MKNLYIITSFLIGFIILSVEIITAKMLSPLFGTGLFVWTSSITVTMMALSLGYFLGGKISKKNTDVSMIYYYLIAAAFFLLLSTSMYRRFDVLYQILPLWMGTMFATTVMIFLPLTILGLMSPILLKKSTEDEQLHHVGWKSSLLSLAGSLGSLFGAVLSGFILLEYFSYKQIMWLNAFLLINLSSCYFIIFRRQYVFLILMMIALYFFPQLKLVKKENNNVAIETIGLKDGAYGEVKVVKVLDKEKDTWSQMMLLDGMPQGIMDLNTQQSSTPYHHVIKNIIEQEKSCQTRVLFVGIGAGLIPKMIENEACYQLRLVDINPDTSKFAKEYFSLKSPIVISDGRKYIQQLKEKQDVVVMDIFSGESIPSHMLTSEFIEETKEKMNENGILIFNVIGHPQGEAENIMYQTLLQHFKHLYIKELNDNQKDNINFILTASNQELNMIPNQKIKKTNHSFIYTDEFNHFDQLTVAKKQKLRKDMMGFLLFIS